MIRVTAFRAMVTYLRNKAARRIIIETVLIRGTAGSATVTHRKSWAARSIDAGVVRTTVTGLITGAVTGWNTADTGAGSLVANP